MSQKNDKNLNKSKQIEKFFSCLSPSLAVLRSLYQLHQMNYARTQNVAEFLCVREKVNRCPIKLSPKQAELLGGEKKRNTFLIFISYFFSFALYLQSASAVANLLQTFMLFTRRKDNCVCRSMKSFFTFETSPNCKETENPPKDT